LALLLLVLTTLSCGDEVSSLKFSPAHLPAARVGKPYAATISVSNNKTPVFQMAIADGRLPAGLVLHVAKSGGTAEIGGVPKATGTFTFAVSASCFGTNTTGQSGKQSYELVVK
jgi:hypothetical protein